MTNRIKKETAELIAFPPMTWHVKEIGWLLEQEPLPSDQIQILGFVDLICGILTIWTSFLGGVIL